MKMIHQEDVNGEHEVCHCVHWQFHIPSDRREEETETETIIWANSCHFCSFSMTNRPQISAHCVGMYLPQENNYCEVEPVDVQFKYWMNPKMIEVAIMHDEEEMIMRATDIDRSVSEGATSTKVEPFTDSKGYSRLGMKVPVFVVTDAVPGSYGRESWEIFLEITNFILKDFDNIKVIMVRTITRISGISVEDINHVLEDRQTRFWLNNLDTMM